MATDRLDGDLRKLVAQITKLSVKIEQSAVDEEKPGYVRNRFGSYDRSDLTTKLFESFSQLLNKSPEEEYFRYLFAGALARSNRLPEAEAEYRSLRTRGGTYGKHAEHMLVSVYLQLGDTISAAEALQKYNERMTADGFPQLQRQLSDFKI